MTERVDVCNKALSMLGEKAITSIDEDSNNAQQLKIHYQTARDGTLEAHQWSFAIHRFIPPSLVITPVYGYQFAFQPPPEIIRVLTAYNTDNIGAGIWNQIPESSRPQVDWVMENNLILCNDPIIYCRGIRRIEEEGRFSPLFVEAFAAKLAALVAINLTASAEIQANMLNFFTAFVEQAKSRDGLQGRSKQFRNRQLQNVR